MNIIDILLILIILSSILFGWARGFIWGLLDLARWIGSLLLGLRFYQPVARLLGSSTSLPEVWNRPLAFILVVAISGLIIQLLGQLLVRRLPKGIHERRVNHLFGMLPGFINGVITAAIIAPLLLALPLPESLRSSSRESLVVNRLAIVTEGLESSVAPIFDEAIRQTLNMRTVEPESDETIKLPYTVKDSRPRADLEDEMLVLVNQERAKAGLQPLAPDPELREVARRHSIDMFERGYFSHYTPEGLSPFDRMQKAGVTYRTAGENLALAPTLAIAHNGLMNSPGHRANILRPQFGRVGIGVMDGGIRGLMISQEFRN